MTKIENKLNIWEYKEYSRWYRIDQKIGLFFRKIKWMFQRAKYGYCDRDLWCLDWTLGNYIAVTTEELANRTHGYPFGTTPETWDETLRSIALSFYLGVNEDCWTNLWEDRLPSKLVSEMTEEEKEIWDNWFAEDAEIHRSMDVRVQEGFKMLEKWFPALWD